MMTVLEVANLAGVSTRTLRYYDQIGLLPPASATEAGYRLYGDADLRRLQQILFLRELAFPLKEIAPMLKAEAGDTRRAVERHRELLRLKMERLQSLIDLCERILQGEDDLDLKPFDESTLAGQREAYAQEAKERWGHTDAYKESARRTAGYTKEDWAMVQAEQEEIFRGFAALVGQDPVGDAVRAQVSKWRDMIGARFYACSDEMLAGLGEMYLADERFRKNLDAYGAGTAALMSEAMRRFRE